MPGSDVPASDPSVVKVKARALDFIAGEDVWSSGLPCAFAVCVTLAFVELASFSALSSFASCSFQATAFNRRMRLASLTLRRKRGSVANVRKVSFRILEYAGDAPLWMRARYESVSRTGALRRMSQTYIRKDDYQFVRDITQLVFLCAHHAIAITLDSLI